MSNRELIPLHPVSAVIRILLVWIYTALYLGSVILFCVLTLGVFSRLIVSKAARGYGRVSLWLLGMRLEVEGLESFEESAPRIVLANHSSTLDILILAAVFPPKGMALAKKELIWIPFIGMVWWALRQAFVDRGNPEKARASIKRAGRILVEEKRTVLIAPEGTRSRDGSIGPFKMGALHLALASQAPIVPLVVVGAAARLPRGEWRVRPGLIRVIISEPIDTTKWKRDELRQRAASLREFYREVIARERAQMGIDLPA